MMRNHCVQVLMIKTIYCCMNIYNVVAKTASTKRCLRKPLPFRETCIKTYDYILVSCELKVCHNFVNYATLF